MNSCWDRLACAIARSPDGTCDPTPCRMRTSYAAQVAARELLDHICAHIREHIATYAIWAPHGRLDAGALTDSIIDHIRDVTPLPVDHVEEFL